MRILFIHPSVELYGADKILLYILKMLYKKHEVVVLLPKIGILNEEIRKISSNIEIKIYPNLPIVHSKLSFFDYLKLPFRIIKCIRLFDKKFDYCFCNTLATILCLFSRFSKKRVLYIHEIIANKFLNFGFSILCKFGANKVVCVSEHVKDNLLFSKNYSVIHNGIPDIAEDFMENKINADGKIRFALPGRFMPQKGQWFLIEALKKLDDEYKKKILIDLYGSAPPFKSELLNTLNQEISRNNLDSIISLHNFTQNIQDIYLNANVILVPSLMADPFPTTVLESLMFSRPVIATNHGGASEILEDSFSRMIIPDDIEGFCIAIKYFIDNQQLIEKFSVAARKKYCSCLNLETYEKKFFDLFLELK